MLKRLRIKFIAVIMSIVTVLFIVIFGFVLHFTTQNIQRESIQMMRAMVFRPPDAVPMGRPDNMPDNIRLPLFTVNISDDGKLTAFGSDLFDLNDETMLKKLVDAVEERKKDTGILPNYDLRYMRDENGFRKAIVFADISREKAMIKGFIRNQVFYFCSMKSSPCRRGS